MTTVERRLKDKIVLLSGATGGLGRATAERLAEEGAHLVLTDLDEQACKAAGERPPGRRPAPDRSASTLPSRHSGWRSPRPSSGSSGASTAW